MNSSFLKTAHCPLCEEEGIETEAEGVLLEMQREEDYIMVVRCSRNHWSVMSVTDQFKTATFDYSEE